MPLPPPSQQGGFFLRSRQRDSKCLFAVQAQRRDLEVPENFPDLTFRERLGLDQIRISNLLSFRDELKRSYAVPADRCQKVECSLARGREPLGNPVADRVVVWKEIVEESGDGLATKGTGPICRTRKPETTLSRRAIRQA